MFNVELLSDRLAAASLEKHRNRELQRQDRIFNARVRTLGVDTEALERQVDEKKKKAEEEKESINIAAADMVRNDKVSCILDSRKAREDRLMARAIEDYRRDFQQPQNQREYDLNNPDLQRNADTDSAQMMLPGLVGEDPGSRARQVQQREQLRAWSVQQHHERAVARQQHTMKERQYDQSRVDLDNRALQLQEMEQRMRKAETLAIRDFNLAKAAEDREARLLQRERDMQEERLDSVNHQQEASQDTMSCLPLQPGAHTRLPPQEIHKIIQFQKYQTSEKKRMESEERKEEEEEDGLRVASARTALLLERRQARLKKQLSQQLNETNASLAEARKQQEQMLAKEYVNGIEDSFFSKFNTSRR